MSEDKLPTYSANKDLLIKASEESTARFVPPDPDTIPDDPYELIRDQLRALLSLPFVRRGDAAVDPLEMSGFPVDALPPVIKDLVEDLSTVHRIDPGLPSMAALATLSGAIGRSVVVDGAYLDKVTHCNLYILIGAPPSYGKSVAGDIIEPFKKASNGLHAEFEEDERFNQEAIIDSANESLKKLKKALREDVSPEDENEIRKKMAAEKKRVAGANFLIKRPPTYMIEKTTVEGLEEGLCRNNENLFSYSPDAGERITEASGKSTAMRDLLLSGHTVEPKMSTTLIRGQKNFTPCLSLLWMTQTSLLEEFFGTPVVSERGLSARILPLFIKDDRDVLKDTGDDLRRDDEPRKAWASLIEGVLESRDKDVALPASLAVKKIFTQWNNDTADLQNGRYREFKLHIGRCREQAIRISGVLATAIGSKKITRKIAEDAIKISGWCLGQTLQILLGHEVVALEEDKRKLTRIMNELIDTAADDADVALATEGWVTFRRVKRSKKAITDERLRELCEKFPEEFTCKKRHKGYIIRLVE